MTIKTIEDLWRKYPACHLHCDITLAGLNSYRVVVSLISPQDETIAEIDYYGSDNLDRVKEQAIKRLISEIQVLSST